MNPIHVQLWFNCFVGSTAEDVEIADEERENPPFPTGIISEVCTVKTSEQQLTKSSATYRRVTLLIQSNPI